LDSQSIPYNPESNNTDESVPYPVLFARSGLDHGSHKLTVFNPDGVILAGAGMFYFMLDSLNITTGDGDERLA
jgi:hypothetical protein